ncbi:TetR/AcrR family transcriptional regulator [Streptantibioticus ferralitis]|uniref:TetR/AcrR family transcriptional regulator n=1 Tax=Streptantibioticus ferralitis TaxID=236510 RepID=A0ABT5Z9Q6_9ACTN|nr:TetR/AcrR family transcriptional regulator [Streptantibioticus ferralitis]MDF2260499.1 TetR/AcrR family transcriptional regulator [Streptantibioticus ferralitis]
MGSVAVERQRPRLRADASRNRERIVTAAREALVEHGPDFPLDEIARRAGVGNATLYRHFADRQQLIRTVTLSVLGRLAEGAEAALAEAPDPFEALQRFVHQAADERVGVLCTLLSGAFEEGDPELVASSDHLTVAMEALIDSAHRSGQLRADVAVGDLMVALSQLTRPLPGTACFTIDRFTHRHLQLFLDGLRAPARSELPGSAVTLEDLQQKS